MCQSKAQGGKRCAAHTPGNQAVVAFVAATTGLDEAQVGSLMRRLRKEHADAPTPDPDRVRGFLDSVAAQAEWDERPSEEQVTAIKRQVKVALADVDAGRLPDGPMMASWEAAQERAARASAALADVITASAKHRRMDPNRAAAAFRNWRRDPEGYQHVEAPDPAFRIDPVAAGLPTDTATRHALTKLGWENYLDQRLPAFVYGTLRQEQANEGRFGDSVEARVQARLFGVAIYGADRGFPYAKEHEDPDAVTVGDLVAISADHEGDRARDSLDMLEGFNSNWPDQSHYRRVAREVQVTGSDGRVRTVKAWTYLAGEWAAASLRESERIADGDWVAAKDAYRRDRFASRRTSIRLLP